MPKTIAGLMGSSVHSGSSKISSPDQLRPILHLLRNHNITSLDTARVYNSGKSEEHLGAVSEAHQHFTIATKAPGFSPGSLAYQKVIDNCNASLAALRQEKIDLYYFHGPDRTTSLEESCRAIHQLHQDGKIGAFGVSNFNVDEVQQIHDICSKNSWVLPTVYQGGYNALGRTAEEKLFPILRRLGMGFYAYSPLAAGFFSRPREQLEKPPAGGRMDQMKFIKDMFVNDLSLRLHDDLTAICAQEGLTLKEATLRWMVHHSALGEKDGIILGASSAEQMEENLKAVEGAPLPEPVVEGFEELWRKYREGGYEPAYCV